MLSSSIPKKCVSLFFPIPKKCVSLFFGLPERDSNGRQRPAKRSAVNQHYIGLPSATHTDLIGGSMRCGNSFRRDHEHALGGTKQVDLDQTHARLS
jgi:hypothetical protein